MRSPQKALRLWPDRRSDRNRVTPGLDDAPTTEPRRPILVAGPSFLP